MTDNIAEEITIKTNSPEYPTQIKLRKKNIFKDENINLSGTSEHKSNATKSAKLPGASFFYELSPESFKDFLEKDPNFGIKIAQRCDLLGEGVIENLKQNKNTLLNNYGILRLLGARVGYRAYAHNRNVQINYQDGLQIEKTKPLISFDELINLNLKKEKLEILEEDDLYWMDDENVFKLVKNRHLSLEKALDLPSETFSRLKRNQPKGRTNYTSLFTLGVGRNFKPLEIIAALPENSWPDPAAISGIAKTFKKEETLEIIKLPEDKIKAIGRTSARTSQNIPNLLRGKHLKVIDFNRYNANQISNIHKGTDAIINGDLSIEDAANYNPEKIELKNETSILKAKFNDLGAPNIPENTLEKIAKDTRLVDMFNGQAQQPQATARLIKKNPKTIEIIADLPDEKIETIYNIYWNNQNIEENSKEQQQLYNIIDEYTTP